MHGCQVPLEAPEEEGMKGETVRPAAAEERSLNAAPAAVLSEPDGLFFCTKEEQIPALKAFLRERKMF